METINPEIIATVVGGTILLIFFTGLIIFSVVLYNKRLLLHKQELKSQEIEFKNELLDLENEVQEATLNNLAQELHDSIGHQVALTKLQLNTLIVRPDQPEELVDKLKLIDSDLSGLLHSVRGVSRGLSGDYINKSHLCDVIFMELNRVKRTGRYELHSEVHACTEYGPSPKLKLVVIRVLQEALSNVIHHAKADTIWVNFLRTRDGHMLWVKDNGVGFNKEKTGLGVGNMKRRAESVGGKIEYSSPEDGGTELTFTIQNEQ